MNKMLVVCMVIVAALACVSFSRPCESVNVTAVVGCNDTLWNVVSEAMAKTGDTRDIREVIYETRELNGINNPGNLQAGQKIIIPCKVVK